ncbi:MAG: ATP-grasp domain-containing protein [Taibaiella sp.]|nr:ATP-grasp domain-containing protein [Taibaiella sp.]
MLLRYGVDFGIHAAVMDKEISAPCSKYTSLFHVGDPMNFDDVIRFGKEIAVITIEKEAVNAEALKRLHINGVKVYPSPETIETIQDKYTQKQFLQEDKIAVVMGWLVGDKTELQSLTDKLPACLKKCKNGYDGSGVFLLRTSEDISKAFDKACVLEELVDVKHEISVIVSGNENGLVECYYPVLMILDKERMLLDFQICPADIDTDTAIRVCAIAQKVAVAIGLTGIIVVEMFIVGNGKIYVNELAPRPNNSGHHTTKASTTSQFEQQIREMLGLPIGNTKLNNASVMISILGLAPHRKKLMMQALKTILCTDDVHLHMYGKTPCKEVRKMIHVTITNINVKDAL